MSPPRVIGHLRWTRVLSWALLLLLHAAAATGREGEPLATPAELYPGLFERVQLERVYDDGKTFVDALPRSAPDRIMAEYRDAVDGPAFDPRVFVTARFRPPSPVGSEYRSDPNVGVETHIDSLWTADLYHKPADEVDPEWDMAGAIADLHLMFEVGRRVANATVWPAWKEGTEFKAVRERMLGTP
jgi:hypothetical protein